MIRRDNDRLYKTRLVRVPANTLFSPEREHFFDPKRYFSHTYTMAARIIAGTLGGALSALAIVKSSTVTANQTNSKALTTSFCTEDNVIATQDMQLAK